jgi:uncharacterized membrane protein (UPF0127 family)
MSRWRPRTTGIIISGGVLVLLAIVVIVIGIHLPTSTQVKLGTNTFDVQLASNDAARKQGLSGVEKMDANAGLLMNFHRDGRWGIWMKDMKIPIDIIWINSDKKVIYIVANASPKLGTSKIFEPNDPARYVLEVPAGTARNSSIRTGDIATFDIKGGQ